MPRSDHNYTQLGIGDCGHVVGTWPQVCDLGGHNPQVICDECMKERHALDPDDVLVVWVRLKPAVSVGIQVPKPKRKPKEPKPKKLTPWETLMQQEGLFDG